MQSHSDALYLEELMHLIGMIHAFDVVDNTHPNNGLLLIHTTLKPDATHALMLHFCLQAVGMVHAFTLHF